MLTIILVVIIGLVVGVKTVGRKEYKELDLKLARTAFLNGYATKKELTLLLNNSNNRDDRKNYLNREQQFQARKALNSL